MTPQLIERRSHPYQKWALPIKLRNLNNDILQYSRKPIKYFSVVKIKYLIVIPVF